MLHPWLRAALGGALIGTSALLLLAYLGRIAGVSGITFTAFTERGPDSRWRWAFLAGLLLGGAALYLFTPEVFAGAPANYPLIIGAGLLVGFGVTLGSGCTSGHGVCGVSRLSPRSLVATTTFLLIGMLTASLIHGGNQ